MRINRVNWFKRIANRYFTAATNQEIEIDSKRFAYGIEYEETLDFAISILNYNRLIFCSQLFDSLSDLVEWFNEKIE